MTGKPRYKPLVPGERFGIMTLVGVSDQRSSSRHMLYKLQCDCGNMGISNAHDLRRGYRVSCGCLRRKTPLEHNAISVLRPKVKWGSFRHSAKNRNIPQDLLFEEWAWLCAQRCAYCGAPGPNGVDRLNNDHTIGYTRENSVPCCKWCNIRKGAVPFHELLEWMQSILKHTGGRVPEAPLPTRNLGKREHVQETMFND